MENIYPERHNGHAARRAPLGELGANRNFQANQPRQLSQKSRQLLNEGVAHQSRSKPSDTRPNSAQSSTNASSGPVIVEDRRKQSTGPTVVRRYRKEKLLGKGGFAKVYQFTNLEKQKILAGKVVEKSSLTKSSAKQKLLTEIRIHRSLEHRHIVGFESFFEDKQHVYIMLEVCPNETLMEVLKKRKTLTEMEVRYYGLQLLDAIRYLHRNNIIHRDLKLGNLFLGKDMSVKLGDFGLAACLDYAEERKQTVCGTPNYIAPEVLSGSHSSEADLWSFGVIMYTMLVGTPPFETKDVKTTYKRIKSNIYSFPPHCSVSSDAQDLVRSLLHPSPSKRPTIDEVCWHPFFAKATNFIPTGLPPSVAHEEPNLDSIECEPGHQVVREMLAKPLGGLRVEVKRSVSATNGKSTQENKENVESLRAGMDELHMMDGGRKQTRDAHGVQDKDSDCLRKAVSGTKPAAPPLAPEGKPTVSPPAVIHEEQEQDDYPNQEDAASVTKVTRNSGRGSSKDFQFNAGAGVASGTDGECHKQDSSHTPASNNFNRNLRHDVDTLKKMHRKLTDSFSHPEEVATDERPEKPSIWVTTWLDYTEKYGMAYLLSNGSVGVFFNDTTKIILASNGENFEYVERTPQKQTGERNGDAKKSSARHAYSLSNYPSTLKKKVTLLKHFKGFLFEEQRKKQHASDEETTAIAAGSEACEMPFVKKWVRTPHAILFRLSNRTVQVNFKDKSSIVLSAEAPLISYVDQSGNRTHHVLATILNEDRPDISRRLRYTKDILHQLIVGSSRETNGENSSR
eukprot:gb/GECG01015787.1/.p1 GENE.gb/GECG01015787.1/~~gb/GECG01015787.1/.p1  ORF type:complete len:793 (+),score=102.09 gb/GECG01015787.1/:1-2379(+)